jgi:SAM-dependent methyltransferase
VSTSGGTPVEGCLRPPPGAARVPRFEAGWLMGEVRRPFLSYVSAAEEDTVSWPEGFRGLHEENSRTHFIDVWTRRAMLARLGLLKVGDTVVDVGCSHGYLLEDLHASAPHATLIGVDLVAGGLHTAHTLVPQALLLQADACDLPLGDACADAVVSVNVLEHVPDDVGALGEIARIMRPGARAVVVIPLGPGNYDYFDRFIGHQRRYARGELARKARRVGLEVREDICLGSLLYPAFWAVKQRNRLRYDDLRGDALARRVAGDLENTHDSPAGRLACRMEEVLLRHSVSLPFGIRGLTVLARPAGGSHNGR